MILKVIESELGLLRAMANFGCGKELCKMSMQHLTISKARELKINRVISK